MNALKRLFLLAAIPALIAAVAMLAVRILAAPLWQNVDPVTGMAYAGLILVLLAIALTGGALAGRDVKFRHVLSWGSVALSFFAVALLDRDYTAWETDRLWVEAQPEFTHRPPRSMAPGTSFSSVRAGETIILQRQPDGHYYVDASINGAEVVFLVDTGATGVAITADDARRIGVNMERLDYRVNVSTANGRALAAPILIRELELPNNRFTDVPALIMQSGGRSLLGMEILEEFRSVEIRDDQLILRR
ncbi:TIGR02281 family clan AA aspartic protease [Maricaulis sp.]|uniref:retropepsin-like aspartic protease family protein n=1 Tax=Maricaulis sp. TaxID=1486257 RepID=UPI00262617FE|nr:TIGR02281 family clan AA aspartic protease [Maricaulis sp.]